MGIPGRDVLVRVADQMDQLATAVRRLSEITEPEPPDSPYAAMPLELVAERVLRQRQARSRFLPPSLFHEPAWEILLSLYVAQRRGRTLNVKHLVGEVDAPVTTAQRWVDALAHMRLVHRISDVQDRRRIELSLTDNAVAAVEAYLAWLAAPPHLDGGPPAIPE